ncbi:PREDICTED: uncharacterized protein LOC106117494 [Papilio xuthus]|uniref:Uncharacterized protein LOC106117494 n=1 Tax=Papilio xuthus TaxID=66420 RepID=A0AAJ7E8Q1_PAPXU|nr:PREDICTED: uncharacterized protein LOC106117494 [Papilio xuthus]
MFDTEKFIKEVQSRECIWNANIDEYNDRELRRKAWEDIGSIMYEGWEGFGENKKNHKMEELRNKWKHLRDYFVREKNKTDNLKYKVEVGEVKKRKTPFLDMLSFLEILRGTKRRTSNIQARATSPESNNSIIIEENNNYSVLNVERSLNTNAKSNENDSTPFQECFLKYMNILEQNNKDPHLNFLLSILPEMRTMNERQLFEFKFEIMKLIKTINYS